MPNEVSIEKRTPAIPDLFTWKDGQVYLVSGFCRSCNTHFFPEFHQQHQPGCSREKVETALLKRQGKLASYTIQYYMPPPPFKTDRDITPYIIGMVEFPEGIQVAGIVTDCPPEKIKTGQSMEVTTFRLYTNEQGQEVETWAFRPVVIA